MMDYPGLALLSHVVHVHMKVSAVVCIHAAQTLNLNRKTDFKGMSVHPFYT